MTQTDLAFPIIDNVVIGCPGNSRTTADFYAQLLQMQVIREDWLMIAKDPDAEPRIAFDDDIDPDHVAAWGDPDRPSQLHLELPTSDLSSATQLAARLGADPLEQRQNVAIFRDPAGHPFYLYADVDDGGTNSPHPLSVIGRVVIDCSSPRLLADFYASFLDMPERLLDTPERVVIGRVDGRLPALGFQRSQSAPPRWPDPAFPQQMHLDIWVDDQNAAHDHVIQAGAIELPGRGGSCPVYADPWGHPFCICT